MSKADPIFSKSDDPTKTLPPELAGKSPEDIAAYYQRRESVILERSRTAIAEASRSTEKKPAEKSEEKFDLFNDPKGSIQRVVTDSVNEAANRVNSVISPAIINACKVTMKDRHPDWNRWSQEVSDAMERMSPDRRMNPDMWEIAYTNVKGRHADEIANEAVENERKRMNPVEKSTPKGGDPPKPRELSAEEKDIARKLEVSPEQFREAAERYESTDGALPMTYDSRNPRKRKAS